MVSSQNCVPECGDALWIDLYPQAGLEKAVRRPAVVLYSLLEFFDPPGGRAREVQVSIPSSYIIFNCDVAN